MGSIIRQLGQRFGGDRPRGMGHSVLIAFLINGQSKKGKEHPVSFSSFFFPVLENRFPDLGNSAGPCYLGLEQALESPGRLLKQVAGPHP